MATDPARITTPERTPEDADAARLRALATHVFEQTVDGLRLIHEEHSAPFRWLMASLLAMNGAGLIGLKDLQLDSNTKTFCSAASFFLGLVCALGVASLGQRANQKMIEPLTRTAMFWRSAALSGTIDENLQKELDSRTNEAMRFSKWPRRAGVASLVFFTIGLLLIAHGWMPN